MVIEMNEKYYQEQLEGLLMILNDDSEKECMIARSYIKEKLIMIKNGQGINFHPHVRDQLQYIRFARKK